MAEKKIQAKEDPPQAQAQAQTLFREWPVAVKSNPGCRAANRKLTVSSLPACSFPLAPSILKGQDSPGQQGRGHGGRREERRESVVGKRHQKKVGQVWKARAGTSWRARDSGSSGFGKESHKEGKRHAALAVAKTPE